jgi:hypothetical protein
MFALVQRGRVVVEPWVASSTCRWSIAAALDRGDEDMGKHEDKAEEQRIIESNGHRPGRNPPPADPGGKHSKPDDTQDDEQGEKDTGT